MSDTEDPDARRDEVLRRMLHTRPQPRKPKARAPTSADPFTYYRHDGAGFRGRTPPSGRSAPAEEVFAGGEWRPYTGDPLEPSTFGSRVSKERAEAK